MTVDLVTNKVELIDLFHRLELCQGDDVMVHSSMSSLGFVVNGAVDVVDALIECIGLDKGTILMPSHSGQLTDPTDWKNPAISKELLKKVQNSMNLFDKKLTPIRGRGVIAEVLLSYPEVKRSRHPLNSVSAIGKRADFYTSSHDVDESEGIDSPIGKLYKNNGTIIGIGVSVDRFTAIHLAEFIADVEYLYEDNPAVLLENKDGNNHFKRIKKYPGNSNNFVKILPILRDLDIIKEVRFKNGIMTCLKLRPVVDCIVKLLDRNPYFLVEDG
mgnify:CR=1 FL=1